MSVIRPLTPELILKQMGQTDVEQFKKGKKRLVSKNRPTRSSPLNANPLSLLRAKRWLEEYDAGIENVEKGDSRRRKAKKAVSKPKQKREKMSKKETMTKIRIVRQGVDPTSYKKCRERFDEINLVDIFDETVELLANLDCVSGKPWSRSKQEMNLQKNKGSRPWRECRLESWGNDSTLIGAAQDLRTKWKSKSMSKATHFKLDIVNRKRKGVQQQSPALRELERLNKRKGNNRNKDRGANALIHGTRNDEGPGRVRKQMRELEAVRCNFLEKSKEVFDAKLQRMQKSAMKNRCGTTALDEHLEPKNRPETSSISSSLSSESDPFLEDSLYDPWGRLPDVETFLSLAPVSKESSAFESESPRSVVSSQSTSSSSSLDKHMVDEIKTEIRVLEEGKSDEAQDVEAAVSREEEEEEEKTDNHKPEEKEEGPKEKDEEICDQDEDQDKGGRSDTDEKLVFDLDETPTVSRTTARHNVREGLTLSDVQNMRRESTMDIDVVIKTTRQTIRMDDAFRLDTPTSQIEENWDLFTPVNKATTPMATPTNKEWGRHVIASPKSKDDLVDDILGGGLQEGSSTSGPGLGMIVDLEDEGELENDDDEEEEVLEADGNKEMDAESTAEANTIKLLESADEGSSETERWDCFSPTNKVLHLETPTNQEWKQHVLPTPKTESALLDSILDVHDKVNDEPDSILDLADDTKEKEEVESDSFMDIQDETKNFDPQNENQEAAETLLHSQDETKVGTDPLSGMPPKKKNLEMLSLSDSGSLNQFGMNTPLSNKDWATPTSKDWESILETPLSGSNPLSGFDFLGVSLQESSSGSKVPSIFDLNQDASSGSSHLDNVFDLHQGTSSDSEILKGEYSVESSGSVLKTSSKDSLKNNSRGSVGRRNPSFRASKAASSRSSVNFVGEDSSDSFYDKMLV